MSWQADIIRRLKFLGANEWCIERELSEATRILNHSHVSEETFFRFFPLVIDHFPDQAHDLASRVNREAVAYWFPHSMWYFSEWAQNRNLCDFNCEDLAPYADLVIRNREDALDYLATRVPEEELPHLAATIPSLSSMVHIDDAIEREGITYHRAEPFLVGVCENSEDNYCVALCTRQCLVLYLGDIPVALMKFYDQQSLLALQSIRLSDGRLPLVKDGIYYASHEQHGVFHEAYVRGKRSLRVDSLDVLFARFIERTDKVERELSSFSGTLPKPS